jgi:hypothetical protein
MALYSSSSCPVKFLICIGRLGCSYRSYFGWLLKDHALVDGKDQFDAFMALAEFWRTRRDARYQALLRISLALWALLAASTVYVKVRPSEPLFILFLIILAVGHALFIRSEILRNLYDTKMTFYYIDHAEKALFEGAIVREGPVAIREMSFQERMIYRSVGEYLTGAKWILPTVLLVLVAYFQLGR